MEEVERGSLWKQQDLEDNRLQNKSGLKPNLQESVFFIYMRIPVICKRKEGLSKYPRIISDRPRVVCKTIGAISKRRSHNESR